MTCRVCNHSKEEHVGSTYNGEEYFQICKECWYNDSDLKGTNSFHKFKSNIDYLEEKYKEQNNA